MNTCAAVCSLLSESWWPLIVGVRNVCFDYITDPDVYKGPPGAIIAGVAVMWIKDWYDKRQQRKGMLKSLRSEVQTAKKAIVKVTKNGFPSKTELEALVEATKKPDVDFDTLDSIPSGWVLFAPSFGYSEVISRLRSDEAEAAISYFDLWFRVMEYEKRHSTSYMKLLESLGPNGNQVRIRELGVLVNDGVACLVSRLEQLVEEGHKLEYLANKGLSSTPRWFYPKYVPFDLSELGFPKDWHPNDDEQKPPPLDLVSHPPSMQPEATFDS